MDAAVYLTPLEPGGRGAALDDGRRFYPASMIKTPLAVAVAAAERAGRLGWLDRVAVEPANLTPNDAPSPLAGGATATIRELVDLMLERSDNVATNVLVDIVERGRATADLLALGFADTAIRRKLSGALPLIADPHATGANTHPPREAARLFARLAAGDLPGAGVIVPALEAQVWNAKLPAGLQAADRFAHKTGDTDDVSHDGGILTLASGARYILVVYSDLPSNEVTDAKFAAFMRALRPLLDG